MIRPATQLDDSRIAEILVFSKRVTYRSIFQDDHYLFCDLQVSNIIDELQEINHDTYFVYDDGIIKGVLHYDVVDMYTWELKELYIDPFFVKEGIGTLFILDLVKRARLLKVRCINTWVVEDNHTACKFYEHLGFQFHNKKQYVEGTPKMEKQYHFYIN